MKTNFDLEMTNIIDGFNGKKKSLLLHCCCAPCATSSIERVLQFFDITAYFYNPNMDTEKEYNLRADELKKLCSYFNINCIIEDYSKNDFMDKVKGLENEKERGVRCDVCYNLRLKKSVLKAKQLGLDYFATTLTLSPLKDSEKLNKIGLYLQEEFGVNYLPTDFKKRGGYLRSIELSKEHNLYRQNYCGCEFSKR